jgi:hypothetical protein
MEHQIEKLIAAIAAAKTKAGKRSGKCLGTALAQLHLALASVKAAGDLAERGE